MASRARLTQERSRLRREALLRAAIELFADGGARAVTHRAVAAKAGLPSASTTYYFESIDQLIREAFALHVERWVAELQQLTSSVGSMGSQTTEDLSQLISQVLTSRTPEVVTTQLSILLAAARDPVLRPALVEAVEAFEHLAASLLRQLGSRNADRLATTVIAMVTGLAFDRLSRRHTHEQEVELMLGSLQALIVADLMNPEERADTLHRLRPRRESPAG